MRGIVGALSLPIAVAIVATIARSRSQAVAAASPEGGEALGSRGDGSAATVDAGATGASKPTVLKPAEATAHQMEGALGRALRQGAERSAEPR